jgi:hypothetical protein
MQSQEIVQTIEAAREQIAALKRRGSKPGNHTLINLHPTLKGGSARAGPPFSFRQILAIMAAAALQWRRLNLTIAAPNANTQGSQSPAKRLRRDGIRRED